MASQWIILTKAGDLQHSLRDDKGTWQAEWLSVFAPGAMKRKPDDGTIESVTCHTDRDGVLHLCVLTSKKKIWHTRRFVDRTWQDHWGDVGGESSGLPESDDVVTLASSVSIDNTVQLCALLKSGKIYHTLRNPDNSWKKAWQQVNVQTTITPDKLFGG